MNKALQLVALVVGSSLVLTASPASAQQVADLEISAEVAAAATRQDRGHDQDRAPGAGRRHLRMAAEATAMLAIGTAWYWRRDDQGRWGGANLVDWQLGFRGASLGHKLGMTRDGWRFDGNSFGLNAVGHPMFGALTYFEARRLKYGVAGSFLISTAASGAWELFTEWAEYGSINDVLSTSTTGVPLGEAAYQLVRGWRQARYTMTVGAGSQGGDSFGALGVRAALDTMPTEGEGMIAGGRKVSIDVAVELDSAVRGIEAGARTTVLGYHRARGASRLFVGASATFSYRDQKDRPAREWDLLATVAGGPTVEAKTQLGRLHVEAGLDTHLAFGMVKSQAFAAWRETNPAAMVRNSMQDKAQPYYYARAFTVAPRLVARVGGLEAGATLTAHALASLDGADRDQEMLTADPHMTDTDLSGRAWVGYTHGAVTVSADRRLHARTGTIAGVTAQTREQTTMLALSFAR